MPYVHLHNPVSYIHFSFHVDVLEGLGSKSVLPQCLMTSRHGAVRRARREYPIDTGLAHLVITLRVDKESHIGVQVPRGFADGTDLYTELARPIPTRNDIPSSSPLLGRPFRTGGMVLAMSGEERMKAEEVSRSSC